MMCSWILSNLFALACVQLSRAVGVSNCNTQSAMTQRPRKCERADHRTTGYKPCPKPPCCCDLHRNLCPKFCDRHSIQAICPFNQGSIIGAIAFQETQGFGCTDFGNGEGLFLQIDLQGFDTQDGVTVHTFRVKSYLGLGPNCTGMGPDFGQGLRGSDLGSYSESQDGSLRVDSARLQNGPTLTGQRSIAGHSVVVLKGPAYQKGTPEVLGCCIVGYADVLQPSQDEYSQPPAPLTPSVPSSNGGDSGAAVSYPAGGQQQQGGGNSAGPQRLGNSGGPQGLGNSAGPQGLGNSAGPQGLGNSGGPQGLGNSGGPQGLGNSAGPQGLGNSAAPQGLSNSAGPQGLGNSGGPQGLGNSGSQGPSRGSVSQPRGPSSFRSASNSVPFDVPGKTARADSILPSSIQNNFRAPEGPRFEDIFGLSVEESPLGRSGFGNGFGPSDRSSGFSKSFFNDFSKGVGLTAEEKSVPKEKDEDEQSGRGQGQKRRGSSAAGRSRNSDDSYVDKGGPPTPPARGNNPNRRSFSTSRASSFGDRSGTSDTQPAGNDPAGQPAASNQVETDQPRAPEKTDRGQTRPAAIPSTGDVYGDSAIPTGSGRVSGTPNPSSPWQGAEGYDRPTLQRQGNESSEVIPTTPVSG